MSHKIVLGVLALAFAASRPLSAQEAGGGEPADSSSQVQPMRVTLDDALEIAMRNNPDLARSRANVDQATYQRLSAFGEFLPNFSLGYSYSNSSTSRLDFTNQGFSRTNYSMTLGGSYDLFTGFRRFKDVKSARLNVNARQASFREQKYSTSLDVKQAYYNAVANRELVDVQQARVKRQQDQLDFIQQQLKLGRATRSDLLSSQVDLNTAKLDLLNAQNSARASTFQLAQAIGVKRRVEPVAKANLQIQPMPLTRDQLQQMAQDGGPTVTAARAQAEAARAQVSVAQSAYYPTLSLSGGYAWSNSEYPPENRSWQISISGRYPIFNGFQRESSVYQAQAQVDQAEASQRSASLQLRTDVDAAYNQMQTARSGIDLAKQSVELSQENLRVSQERYRLGLATILDLQAAQIALQQAQVDLIQRRFDYQVGLAKLESLLGRDLREDGAGSSPPPGQDDGH